MARKSKKSNFVNVNFDGVESGIPLAEGDYIAEVDEAELKTSDSSGKDYISFTFKVVDGPGKGSKVWHNCSLQPQALFNLRGVLESLGVEVPEGAFEFDPADLIGQTCQITVQHESYEGRNKPRIVEFAPPPADEESAEEDKPEPKKGKKGKKGKKALKVGAAVEFTDDEDETISGTVSDIDGDTLTVEDEDGDEWELDASDVTLV